MVRLFHFFVYRWHGSSEQGISLAGEMRAPNVSLVIAHLLDFGIKVNGVKRKNCCLPIKKILTPQLRIQLTEQLANLLSAGVSMSRALNILEQSFSSIRIKTLLWFMQRYIESGQSLGELLYWFPKEFNLAYRQLVAVGENSGQLEQVLLHLTDWERKQILIRDKVKKASFYPVIVLGFSVLIMLLLLMVIVPEFVEIFKQANLTLPLITLLLVDSSNFLFRHGFLLIFILLVGSFAYGYFWQTSVSVKKVTLKFFLSVPWVGSLINYFFFSRFSYGLATLLQTGIAVVQAVEILLKNTTHPFYLELFEHLLTLLKQGNSLSQGLKHLSLFPDFFVYTIKVGEEAGLTSSSLMKAADFYDAEIDKVIDGISLLLEPALIIILGLIIGIFIVALYLPIFNLGNAV